MLSNSVTPLTTASHWAQTVRFWLTPVGDSRCCVRLTSAAAVLWPPTVLTHSQTFLTDCVNQLAVMLSSWTSLYAVVILHK